jgi:hypothetical protein
MEAAFYDGSALYFKGPGTAVVKGQTVDLRVPITIIGGKGKYAGAKGDGQLIGTRMQPLPGQGAQISNEVTLKISCPNAGCSRQLTSPMGADNERRQAIILAYVCFGAAGLRVALMIMGSWLSNPNDL